MGSKCSKCNQKENLGHSQSFSVVEETGPDKVTQVPNKAQSLDDSIQIKNLKELLEKTPENPALNIKVALHLYQKNSLQDAERHFEAAIQNQAKLDFESCMALGTIKSTKGNHTEALEFFTKATKLQSHQAEPWFKAGEEHLHLEQNQEALENFQEALKFEENHECYNMLGLCYLNLKDYDNSIEFLKKALELSPEFSKAHNNIGNAYRKVGKDKRAIKHYLLAIENTPKRKFAIAHLNLATTYFDTGDTISALRHFEEALQVGSHIHKVMVSKGYHLLFKNSQTKEGIEFLLRQEYQKAVDVLVEVVNTDPENPAVNYYLGLAHSKLNNLEQANHYYHQVVDLGTRPIHRSKQFIKHFVKKSKKAIKKYSQELTSGFHERACSQVLDADSFIELLLPHEPSSLSNSVHLAPSPALSEEAPDQ